jgi:acyl-CoA thioester hydrolase
MGYVHHASYFPWLEIGRTELLRDTGVTYRAMEQDGVFLVIVKLEARFRRPGRYDDLIEVRTRITGGSRVKLHHEYEVVRIGTAEEVLMKAISTLACVDKDGRPRELPAWLQAFTAA